MKSFLNKLLLSLRFDKEKSAVSHVSTSIPEGNSMSSGLLRRKHSGLVPTTIIDVGAAQGKWSLEAMKIWNNSNFVLFEPLKEREKDVDMIAATHRNCFVVKAVAGDKKGQIVFYVTEDLDGSGIADNGTGADRRSVNVTTIDDEISKLGLSGPFLLKLDTHGYEVPIIEGATATLKATELCVIESYGFQIAPNSLLFWEMCQYMDSKGFRLIDIVDLMHRGKDKAFWQCDAFFVPKCHESFKYSTYHF